MDVITVSVLMVAAFWGIFSRWLGYTAAGYAYSMSVDGNYKITAVKMAFLELGYILFANMFVILPLGSLVTGLMMLFMPVVMVSTIKSVYDQGLANGIMIYIISYIVSVIVGLPTYYLTTLV